MQLFDFACDMNCSRLSWFSVFFVCVELLFVECFVCGVLCLCCGFGVLCLWRVLLAAFIDFVVFNHSCRCFVYGTAVPLL